MVGLRLRAACLIAAALAATTALAHDPASQQAGPPTPGGGAATRFAATVPSDGAEVPVLAIRQGTRALLEIHGAGTAELHLHGYDIEAAGSANGPAELIFQADHQGRFPVEMHLEDDLLGRAERAILYVEVRGE